jgi:putative SOS response-associated peptidase YedK
MVKQITEGTPGNLQCQGRNRCQKADDQGCVRRNRCLVPVSGYYEWHVSERAALLLRASERLDTNDSRVVGAIARSGEKWDDCLHHAHYRQYHFVGSIHDRMPVVLQPETIGSWLLGDCRNGIAATRPGRCVEDGPVSKRVSEAGKRDDASLIDLSVATTRCASWHHLYCL